MIQGLVHYFHPYFDSDIGKSVSVFDSCWFSGGELKVTFGNDLLRVCCEIPVRSLGIFPILSICFVCVLVNAVCSLLSFKL